MYTRRTLFTALAAGAAALLAEMALVETRWLRINRFRLPAPLGFRLVHISDLHFHWEASFLESIVEQVNQQQPDVVCFTGDLVDKAAHLGPALDGLSSIGAPLFGVPGNHDYWSGASFSRIRKAFQSTGGDWILDATACACDGMLRITGLCGRYPKPGIAAAKQNAEPSRSILLSHYPAVIKDLLALSGRNRPRFDLTLTGHSHGGQIRLPFLGALFLPFWVEGYVRGWYTTPAGPMYVNVGLGTTALPLRFLCRPDRKSTRLNSSHRLRSRMPSSA